jgi:hypothetical protein
LGQYTELEPDELDAIALESKRIIEIDEFVPMTLLLAPALAALTAGTAAGHVLRRGKSDSGHQGGRSVVSGNA